MGVMEGKKRRPVLFRDPPKRLFDDEQDETYAYARGPLFSKPVLYTLLAVFGGSLMLTADWFGLLLLNAEGVIGAIGLLNTVRVMAALMTGIAISSLLLMFHYRRARSYVSEENVFFAVTFALSFMMGLPCALVGLFG